MADQYDEPVRRHSGETSGDIDNANSNKQLREFHDSDILYDFIIIVEDEQIPVHKATMAACSGYFRSMIKPESDMKESHENTVRLDGIDAVGLRAIVDFAYSGKINIDLDNVSSILHAASYLHVREVVKHCEEYLKSVTNLDNCVDIHSIADLYVLDMLPVIEKFVVENFHNLLKKQYTALPKDRLVAILGDDRMTIPSESYLVTIVKDWLEFNKYCDFGETQNLIQPHEEPWVTFTLMMSKLRWPLLGVDGLRDIDGEILHVMKTIPNCSAFIQEAESYHSDIHKQPLMQNERTRVRCDSQRLVVLPIPNTSNPNEYKLCDITQEFEDGNTLEGIKDNRNALLRKPSDYVNYQEAVSFNNFLFVCGGEENDDVSRLCFRFDPRFNEWVEISPMITARDGFVFVAHKDHLYVTGGGDKAPIVSDDGLFQTLPLYRTISKCESFDIGKNTWCTITEYYTGISWHAGCVVDNDIYISGGRHDLPCRRPFSFVRQSEMLRYNIPTGEWHKCAAMKYDREGHIMQAISRNTIYVIGGIAEDYGQFGGYSHRPMPNERPHMIERYSVETDQWTECKQIDECYNQVSGAFVWDKKLYVR